MEYNQLAANYAAHLTLHPRVVRSLVLHAQLTADSHVLEIGCGTGNYTMAIHKAAICQCWGSVSLRPITKPSTYRIKLRILKSTVIRHSRAYISSPMMRFAVGGKEFVEMVKDRVGYKAIGIKISGTKGDFELKEDMSPYRASFTAKMIP